MAMGIVSSDIFDAEIIATSKRAEPQIIDINRGRSNTNAVPSTMRNVIGEEAIKGTPVDELSKIFGISKSSISAYKNGANSTASYNDGDPKLKKHIDTVKESIAGTAREKIIAALSCIDEHKLAEEKLRDVAGIAKDMATVMEKMEGTDKNIGNQVNQVIVYAPRMREEDDYKTIDVGGL